MAEKQCQNCHTLRAACDEAFIRYPHSCSHSVWHVIKNYIPSQPYLTANSLIHNLTTSPRWQEVPIHDLSRLASEGALVVGGAVESSHGHVIVVYPGQAKFDGGYYYKSREGKAILAGPHGTYPLAMSTSMGNWPGAKSKGDKTVADPWGLDKFKDVKFWKYIGD
jgi:hypothetical protein